VSAEATVGPAVGRCAELAQDVPREAPEGRAAREARGPHRAQVGSRVEEQQRQALVLVAAEHVVQIGLRRRTALDGEQTRDAPPEQRGRGGQIVRKEHPAVVKGARAEGALGARRASSTNAG
jgi:hypothetical protein